MITCRPLLTVADTSSGHALVDGPGTGHLHIDLAGKAVTFVGDGAGAGGFALFGVTDDRPVDGVAIDALRGDLTIIILGLCVLLRNQVFFGETHGVGHWRHGKGEICHFHFAGDFPAPFI